MTKQQYKNYHFELERDTTSGEWYEEKIIHCSCNHNVPEEYVYRNKLGQLVCVRCAKGDVEEY